MDKLSASNAKNKSACYGNDCHFDEWLLGSQHIHQLCTATDLNEHITLHTEHIQIMTGKDSLGGLSEYQLYGPIKSCQKIDTMVKFREKLVYGS